MKLDRTQFEALAMEHLDTLYRMARRLTRDEASAEDLVQETYLRALRSYESFDLKEFGIRPWLLRILHNLHASRFKREKRQPLSVDDEQLQTVALASEGAQSAGAGTVWDGMDEQLVQAVDSLPEEYRTVLMLWAIEELSYKEIAEAVDVPIGTVMSRLFRARQKLSDQLQAFAVQQGTLRAPSPPTPTPDAVRP
jgi:RNA polymerase sigma-70 factor (ECF subfamily)